MNTDSDISSNKKDKRRCANYAFTCCNHLNLWVDGKFNSNDIREQTLQYYTSITLSNTKCRIWVTNVVNILHVISEGERTKRLLEQSAKGVNHTMSGHPVIYRHTLP